MFANSFDLVSYLKSGMAIILVGLVIKIMDDFLDEEWPPSRGLLRTLGKGVLPYSIVIFLLAISLDFSLTVALFLASYITGMIFVTNHVLPSGLSSWLESILAILLSVLIAGYDLTLWAILIMLAVQLIDDYLDYRNDQRRGLPN